MPNFLMLDDANITPLPSNRRYGFGGGGGGGAPKVDYEAQMRRQEEMFKRQMDLQARYQREAEDRLRMERDREKQMELLRRQEQAAMKKERLESEEGQESALTQEMTGQVKGEMTEFGGGFNLDMPTIERPGYEQETRPQ
jgi:hypothetical protein